MWLGGGVSGRPFLEVPSSRDTLGIITPARFTVIWLPRDNADHGELLIPKVLEYLGTRHHAPQAPREGPRHRPRAGGLHGYWRRGVSMRG